MKKLVLKTVVITLACVVAAGAIAYILLVTAFPGTLASIYGNMGGYEKAAYYLVNDYNNKGDISSIVSAGDYAAKSGKDKLIVTTVEKFISDDEFDSYTEDNASHSVFLTSKYIVARYNTDGGSQELVDKAFSLLVAYDSHNQVESLIFVAYDISDKDTLSLISARLDGLDTSLFTDAQLTAYNNDKVIIERALN